MLPGVPAPGVVVVGETPSLGRAIVDLLQSDGVDCRYVRGLGARSTAERMLRGTRLVVVASNGPFSPTVRRWQREALAGPTLVVVGSRDPVATAAAVRHRVDLPLSPRPFLDLIRTLLAGRDLA